MTEKEKEELHEKAKLFRQCADILEEMAETEDTDKTKELTGQFVITMMKIGM